MAVVGQPANRVYGFYVLARAPPLPSLRGIRLPIGRGAKRSRTRRPLRMPWDVFPHVHILPARETLRQPQAVNAAGLKKLLHPPAPGRNLSLQSASDRKSVV